MWIARLLAKLCRINPASICPCIDRLSIQPSINLFSHLFISDIMCVYIYIYIPLNIMYTYMCMYMCMYMYM